MTLKKIRVPDGVQKILPMIFSCTMLSGASQTIPRVFPAQYCPRNIKTTLYRIFSCSMLSVASQTTSHRVFTCAMLLQRY